MVPNVTKGGASFKGAAAYYLHDKEAETAERVAWTETVNLITSDPEKATRVMAATAIAQNELKFEAGIKARGRKLEKPVYVYSLSWHPDEQPNKATMIEAARESLQALGIEDRQALIVCHNDEPHPHVHVIVNRVSMEDGRAANMFGDHLKLSRWAEGWEKRHGKIWCEARVQNNERREQGEIVRGSTNVPRSAFEAIRDGTKALNDNRGAHQAATELKADQQRKAAELMAQGRAMHQHYRDELAGLAADYRRDKAKIVEAGREERRQLREQLKIEFRQAKAALLAQQQKEWQTTVWRERSLLGRVWNAHDAGRSAESAVGRIGKTLWASVSRTSRLMSLHQHRKEGRQAILQARNSEARERQEEQSADIDRRLDGNHKRYLTARASTLLRYDAEKRDYAGKWAERIEAQRETWRQFREKWEPLERDRQRHERQQANLQELHEQQRKNLRHLREQEERGASRQPGRGRSRSYGDERER